jgi:peptidoglycan/LPS O-acetylase OafA/YrhL
LPYSAPLDGVRALAILAVLVYHLFPTALPGGFTGVDAFFTLSGFLITSILLHQATQGPVDLREFYLRRIQRLLPNAVATVGGTLLLAWVLLPPSEAHLAGKHGLWSLFNLSNIFVWKHMGDYWGPVAEGSLLTHTWSLGIEEQFYLLFPSLLLLAHRRFRDRLNIVITAGGAISLAVYTWGTHAHPVATFYLLPTRMWELLVGGALAAWSLRRDPTMLAPPTGPWLAIAGGLGCALLMAGFGFIHLPTQGLGLVALAPTLGTALILASLRGASTPLSRLLGSGPLVALGKGSYSLYLWHWPLILLGSAVAPLHGLQPVHGALVGAAAACLVAWIAYRFLEAPLRDRGPGRNRRLAFIAGSFTLTLGLALGLSRQRAVADPEHRFEAPRFLGYHYHVGNPVDPSRTSWSPAMDVIYPPVPPRPREAWKEGGILHPGSIQRPEVVVWGSSHALMYSRLIDDLCRERSWGVAFWGMAAVPVFLDEQAASGAFAAGEHRAFNALRLARLQVWRPRVLFLIDRWDLRAEDPRFAVSLDHLLDTVTPLAERIILVAQPPVAAWGDRFNPRELVNDRWSGRGPLPPFPPDDREAFRRQVVARAETLRGKYPNLQVLRVDAPFYQSDGSVRYAEGRTFFYLDDDHLTDAGSEQARVHFAAALELKP